jgi:DNA-binding response OmpR family regulator
MSKTVLIIEDEVDIRVLYAEYLRDQGFDVIECGDGQSGLDNIKAGNWDILLLDIMLPKMDGFEILKNTRENEPTKIKPVVLMTNLDNESIRQRGQDLGANGYIVKSEITPQDVLDSVKRFFPDD